MARRRGRRGGLGGGGVAAPLGWAGHADGDRLVPAIIDELVGGAGLGDIGSHFPDTDARFKGADSLTLLVETARLLAARGYGIGNIDSTVVAQAPRLAPQIPAMRARIAQALGLQESQVNGKSKNAERLGPVGKGMGREGRAVVWRFYTVLKMTVLRG